MLLGVTGQLVSHACLEQCVGGKVGLGEARRPERRALERWRRGCATLGPASSPRTLLEVGAEPLVRVLGFIPIARPDQRREAVIVGLRGTFGTATLLVAPWGARLEPLWRQAVVETRQRQARWALLFNGTHLRLLDAGRTFVRRHLEFDLDLAVDDDRTFLALWTTVGADALRDTAGGTTRALPDLIATSEAQTATVCRSLREGVRAASIDVLRALVGRQRVSNLTGPFEQALTIVYRILFLLFAEARGLVPIWHPVYRESYSIDALRLAAEQGRAVGLWDGLRAVSRLAHAGCRAGNLKVTAFNGRLFDQTRVPLAERADLDDEAARRTLLALTTRPSADRLGRERISYGDLGVEQLGAVYETLLDFVPRPQREESSATAKSPRAGRRTTPGDGRRNAGAVLDGTTGGPAIVMTADSGIRKSTGTFYTPQPIARYLVRTTLAPLVRDRAPEQILALRVLDPAMGSGAFLVEACTFLAHTYEEALIASGGCSPSDLGPQDRAAIRRRIAERCLFGVDLNPMAVQLARLSLWLTTLAHDRPLSFFDHHLRIGDSLIGAWVSNLRSAPHKRAGTARPDDRSLFGPDVSDMALRAILPVRFSLDEPNDTVDAVRRKERALAALEERDSQLSKWKRIADLWCATWFAGPEAAPRSAFAALSDFVLFGRADLPAESATRYVARSSAIATARRFFHWELEFPEVFFDTNGHRLPTAGFDAVIGNPPWDMVRADWGGADQRRHARDQDAGLLRFVREAGLYVARSRGHANRYQLFVERIIELLKLGGRFGLVLPSGFAADHGSGELRRQVFSRCTVEGLVGFDNRRAVFPVHRSVRFLLLTGAAGGSTVRMGARLGEVDPAVLDADEVGREAWFPIHVTPALLARLSGDGLAIPDLRTPTDLAIAERAAGRFPPLADPTGWGAQFGRELNASDDRDLLHPPGHAIPIVEGKQLAPFRVRTDEARYSALARDLQAQLGTRHLRPRLAYRDVASATNRVTLIAAIVPAGCASTHTVFCLKTPLRLAAQHFLCGLFNSLVVNYLVRLRVTTHVTTAIVEQLPIPKREDGPAAFREIARLACQLQAQWSREAFARLNALVARLYRLSAAELAHVVETFPLVDKEDRDAAVRAFASQDE